MKRVPFFAAVAALSMAAAGAADLTVSAAVDTFMGSADQAAMVTHLGATTAGANLFKVTDPDAIRFVRINADNTVSLLTDSEMLTALGAGGGGLTNWTESLGTASPNSTVNSAQFLATGGVSNIDAVITPKGTGALLAQVPDATSSGGNKRGSYAVDLQRSRNAADQVASGSSATIGGGARNRASGTQTTVGGGYSNTATGNDSTVAGGSSNTAGSSQRSTVGGGYNNTASSDHSTVAGGSSNTASASYSSVLGGSSNTASGLYSSAMGRDAVARTEYSFARGIENFSTDGDAQVVAYLQKQITTDATPARMNSRAITSSGTGFNITLPDNTACGIRARVVAKSSGGDVAYWHLSGIVKRVSGTASTVLVGSATVTLIAADAGASTWDVDLQASNSGFGGPTIEVTGAAATTIRWFGEIETTELGY